MTDSTPTPSQAPDKAGVVERCPLEQAVENALVAAGERFTCEPHEGQRLDFHLTERNVFIEVKAWHSPRISDQMASERNVIALQGPEAVTFFCSALSPPPVVEEAGLGFDAAVAAIEAWADGFTPSSDTATHLRLTAKDLRRNRETILANVAPIPTAGEESVEEDGDDAKLVGWLRGLADFQPPNFPNRKRLLREAADRLAALPSHRGVTIPDELRELSEKATEGPWEAIKGVEASDDMRCGVAAVRGDRSYLTATIENGAPGDFCDTEYANALLIVAAVNFIRQALKESSR